MKFNPLDFLLTSNMETPSPTAQVILDIPAYVENMKVLAEQRKIKERQESEEKKLQRHQQHRPEVEKLLEKCRSAVEDGYHLIIDKHALDDQLILSFTEMTGIKLVFVAIHKPRESYYKFTLPE